MSFKWLTKSLGTLEVGDFIFYMALAVLVGMCLGLLSSVVLIHYYPN